MTFSIVARSDDGRSLGVAVASRFLAVGAVVPGADPAAGAVATQSLANLRYVPEGLAAMRAGHSATEALASLTQADPARASRQLGMVDHRGGSATFTGADCFPWAGGITGPGYAIQGNILTGPQVVESMQRAWADGDPDAPLARRLLDALAAGDVAGGDRRGRQSAAVLVVRAGAGYGGGSDVEVDLRVDDHRDPVRELARLLDVHDLLFGRTPVEDCLPLSGEVAAEVRGLLDRLGYSRGTVDDDLADLAGVENLEERLVPGRIDPVVLGHLRRIAAP